MALSCLPGSGWQRAQAGAAAEGTAAPAFSMPEAEERRCAVALVGLEWMGGGGQGVGGGEG